MRSKSPLTLMEQLVMILVFALAAALCLQVFVFAGRVSARSEQTDHAVLVCQNAAETLKAAGRTASGADAALEQAAQLLGGTLSQGVLNVYYDENWEQTEHESNCAYLLRAQALPAAVTGLCRADVRVEPAGGADPLFSLTVAWQEVSAHE